MIDLNILHASSGNGVPSARLWWIFSWNDGPTKAAIIAFAEGAAKDVAPEDLSEADCVEGRQFDDQIACFSFIDNSRYFVRGAGAYGIPYRALLPRGVDNLLIAGRMMTVDLVAHNSTRNTVCCLACGQAAGLAAAQAVAQGRAPRELDVTRLRQALAEAGALLTPRPDPL